MATPATATPQPGTLEAGTKVDVGGYQLFIRCSGKGAPPAIFDAGASSGSSVWRAVEPNVAAFTTTCVYDRANRGISDKGPIPNTSQQMVHDLHTLLAKAQIAGPLVLVGQSFGGMNMGLYTRLYPADVAGLVMVDAVHEAVYMDQSITPCPYRECNGVNYTESGRQVSAAPPMPEIPLIVLQHGVPGVHRPPVEARWPAWQQELASRSPRGKLVLAERSTHNIHQDQPDLVVAAVREVVEQTRRYMNAPIGDSRATLKQPQLGT
jgi:pimeloyl-ACP methyl ester carboxylesterase